MAFSIIMYVNSYMLRKKQIINYAVQDSDSLSQVIISLHLDKEANKRFICTLIKYQSKTNQNKLKIVAHNIDASS